MSHTTYISSILAAGILSLIGWSVVLIRLDPFVTHNTTALVLFFISFFFSLSSFFTVIGYYLRVLINKNEIYYAHIIISLREGILFSFFVCASLGLQARKVLTWWNLILLFIAVFLLEAYFISKNTTR